MDILPTPLPPHTSAGFDAMRRNFEMASISEGTNDKKQRIPTGSSQTPVVQGPSIPQHLSPQTGNGLGGATGGGTGIIYNDVYAPAEGFAQYGVFGAGNGAGVMPFVPQNQQHPPSGHQAASSSMIGGSKNSHGHQVGNSVSHQQSSGSPLLNHFPNTASPYLTGSTNPQNGGGGMPFGSSNGLQPNGLSTQPQSYNGSTFNGQYDTMPSSPNPYASHNPYAGMGFGGLSFTGSPYIGGGGGSGVGGVGGGGGMPGMNGMNLGSPQLGGMQQGFGLPMQMMNQNTVGMNPPTSSGRTVYVGNLPSDASIDELLSQVRFGPIDSVKILPEKQCLFISFVDSNTAAAFHSDALMRKLRLHDQDLKIGWGKPSVLPANVVMAIQQQGATRNVYLGNLDETATEQSLRDDLSRFGPIDQVKIVRDKNIGFVHFLSIATAIKVVQSLATEPEWAGRRVSYGKDRCAYVPKNQHQQQQHNMAAAAMGSMAANYGGFGGMAGPFSPVLGGFSPDLSGMQGSSDPNAQPGNRTVYLGNIHPETTTEEICNIIRGGILQQIRYIPDKHICFVTFVESQCALAFYQMASMQGIAIHNRRLKVGWGKHSGPTSPGIAMVVQSGGSRNVYIGNIDDFETFSEERLRKDFGEYGEIELINSLPVKQASFVNFTKIANSIKAIEGMKSNPDYAQLKIAYGKDRCGGVPRAFRGFDLNPQQRQQMMGRSPYMMHQGPGSPAMFSDPGNSTSPVPPIASAFPTSATPAVTASATAADPQHLEFGTAEHLVDGAGSLVLDDPSPVTEEK